MKIEAFLISAQLILFGSASIWGAVSPVTSRLVLMNSRAAANGHAQVTVGIDLRDESGTPMSGKNVVLQSNNNNFQFIQPSLTDLNGSATGYLTSKTVGAGDIWGIVDGVRVDPNLLSNPSFEKGVNKPESWDQFTNQTISAPDEALLWSVDTASRTNKSAGMYVSNLVVPTYELSWYQNVQHPDLLPGTTYTLCVLVKSGTDYFVPGNQSGLFLSVTNEDPIGNPITSTRSVSASITNGWKSVRISSVVYPQGASQIEISLDYSRSTGTAYFDNARLSLWPPVEFSADHSSPSIITTSSPTLLSAVSGGKNGEITLSWYAVGNDGMSWPNPEGLYEIKISNNYGSIPVSSWTSVNVTVAPASPGTKETLTLAGLTPNTTYQIAIRAVDQSNNKSEFGLTVPVAARGGVAPISILSVDSAIKDKPQVSRPLFSGDTQAGAGVLVFVDGDEIGQTYADYKGKWKYKALSALSEGTHLGAFQAYDANGNTSNKLELTFQVGAAGSADELKPPYPNPIQLSLRQNAKIEFSVTTRSHVKIRIFDYNGHEVKLLNEADYDLGSYTLEWDGRDNEGNAVASNAYLLLYETDRDRQIKPLTVIR